MTGVQILSLDGGSVRGVIEVRILMEIEKKLGGKIPIQMFFDVIAGTSTGALLSLGLGIKDWTLADCLEKYKSLCDQAFVKQLISVPGNISGTARRIGNYIAALASGSMYQNIPLNRALEREYGKFTLCGTQVSSPLRDIEIYTT
jgi:patatin-like phospholipase/acyl hydrolase